MYTQSLIDFMCFGVILIILPNIVYGYPEPLNDYVSNAPICRSNEQIKTFETNNVRPLNLAQLPRPLPPAPTFIQTLPIPTTEAAVTSTTTDKISSLDLSSNPRYSRPILLHKPSYPSTSQNYVSYTKTPPESTTITQETSSLPLSNVENSTTETIQNVGSSSSPKTLISINDPVSVSNEELKVTERSHMESPAPTEAQEIIVSKQDFANTAVDNKISEPNSFSTQSELLTYTEKIAQQKQKDPQEVEEKNLIKSDFTNDSKPITNNNFSFPPRYQSTAVTTEEIYKIASVTPSLSNQPARFTFSPRYQMVSSTQLPVQSEFLTNRSTEPSIAYKPSISPLRPRPVFSLIDNSLVKEDTKPGYSRPFGYPLNQASVPDSYRTTQIPFYQQARQNNLRFPSEISTENALPSNIVDQASVPDSYRTTQIPFNQQTRQNNLRFPPEISTENALSSTVVNQASVTDSYRTTQIPFNEQSRQNNLRFPSEITTENALSSTAVNQASVTDSYRTTQIPFNQQSRQNNLRFPSEITTENALSSTVVNQASVTDSYRTTQIPFNQQSRQNNLRFPSEITTENALSSTVVNQASVTDSYRTTQLPFNQQTRQNNLQIPSEITTENALSSTTLNLIRLESKTEADYKISDHFNTLEAVSSDPVLKTDISSTPQTLTFTVPQTTTFTDYSYRPQSSTSFPNYLPTTTESTQISSTVNSVDVIREQTMPQQPKIPLHNINNNRIVEPVLINNTYGNPVNYFSSNFQCNVDNGYIGLADSCYSYVECKNRIPTKNSCPDTFYFNPSISWPGNPCTYSALVNCNRKQPMQISKPSAECQTEEGLFPINDGDCSRYLMCQRGKATIMHCPLGLVFNPATSSCDWPINVNSCRPNVFQGFSCPTPSLEGGGKPSDIILKFKFGNSCKQYIACQHGEPRLLSCDPATSFDENSSTCTETKYVPNCAHIEE